MTKMSISSVRLVEFDDSLNTTTSSRRPTTKQFNKVSQGGILIKHSMQYKSIAIDYGRSTQGMNIFNVIPCGRNWNLKKYGFSLAISK